MAACVDAVFLCYWGWNPRFHSGYAKIVTLSHIPPALGDIDLVTKKKHPKAKYEVPFPELQVKLVPDLVVESLFSLLTLQ